MNNSTHYIILGLIILIGIIAIVIAARRKEKEMLGEDSQLINHQAAIDPAEQEQEETKRKRMTAVTAGLVILAVAGVVVNIFLGEKISSGDGGTDTSFVPFLPVWIAIFIPILTKKKKQDLSESQRKMVMILITAIVLVVLGMAVLVFFVNK